MKKKLKPTYCYKFKTNKEIESCANCPMGEEYPDDENFYCKLLECYFSLKGENFPPFCPLEENIPEDMGHR